MVIPFAFPAVVFRVQIILNACDAVPGFESRFLFGRQPIEQVFFIHYDRANITAAAHFSLHGCDRKIGCGQHLAGIPIYPFGLYIEDANAPVVVDFSAQARTREDGHGRIVARHRIARQPNTPGKERPGVRKTKSGKQIAVFEEKLPSFGKKQLKTAQIWHLSIHFHLRKIGIDGQVQVERRGYGNLCVAPNTQFLFTGPVADNTLFIALIINPVLAGKIGNQGNIAAGTGRRRIPNQVAREGQVVGCKLLRNGPPGTYLPGLKIGSNKVHMPTILPGPNFIPQGFERNRHFDRPIFIFILNRRVPFIVPLVGEVGAIIHQCLALYIQWI